MNGYEKLVIMDVSMCHCLYCRRHHDIYRVCTIFIRTNGIFCAVLASFFVKLIRLLRDEENKQLDFITLFISYNVANMLQ